MIIFPEEECQEMEKMRQYAEEHRVDAETLAAMGRGEVKPAGKPEDNFTCTFDSGLMMVFSIEEQPPPVNYARHLSLSSRAPGDIEFLFTSVTEWGIWGKDMIREALRIFGFQETDVRKQRVHIDHNHPQTFHIIEPVNSTWEELVKSLRLLTDKDVEELIKDGKKPFKWAPGLIKYDY